jgi:L-2-hydroxyglutarate oxidase
VTTSRQYDIVVVGGGIVGLAVAHAVCRRHPAMRLGILEKEPAVARHQTGHNSGVVHAGLYYRPGSLKAQLCVSGAQRMAAFCDERCLRYERCGKLVVAVDESEVPRLKELYRRGTANGVPDLHWLDAREVRRVEPHAQGVAALHSPHTAIADYPAVARALAADLVDRGADLLLGTRFAAARQDTGSLHVATSQGEIRTRSLINCAGLHADQVARMMGAEVDVTIVPFRGEYYFIRPERHALVRGLIYPVPDPGLPFLGVHFTRTVDGRVEAGPNAVWAFAREGYQLTTVDLADLAGMARSRAFWRLARRYWRTGLTEFRRSLSKQAFAHALQRLVPAIQVGDLLPGGAGVRAQAVAADGSLIDDFVIAHSWQALHVLNAPSPAATASLSIGEYVADRAIGAFDL